MHACMVPHYTIYTPRYSAGAEGGVGKYIYIFRGYLRRRCLEGARVSGRKTFCLGLEKYIIFGGPGSGYPHTLTRPGRGGDGGGGWVKGYYHTLYYSSVGFEMEGRDDRRTGGREQILE